MKPIHPRPLSWKDSWVYHATIQGADIYTGEISMGYTPFAYVLGENRHGRPFSWDCTPWNLDVPHFVKEYCQAYQNMMS